MKQLSEYINEDFKLSRNTIIPKKVKTFVDLKFKIIDERYRKNPKYLDLRDIDICEITCFRWGDKYNSHTSLFENFDKVEIIDITGWETSQVTTMERTFKGCTNLQEIKGIENIDVSGCYSFEAMFEDCRNVTLNLYNWKVNSINSSCVSMFAGCNQNKITYWKLQ